MVSLVIVGTCLNMEVVSLIKEVRLLLGPGRAVVPLGRIVILPGPAGKEASLLSFPLNG